MAYQSIYGIKSATTTEDTPQQSQEKRVNQAQQQVRQQAQKKKKKQEDEQKAKSGSLFNKIKSVSKTVAKAAVTSEDKFATGIARVLPGGTADLDAQRKQAESATKNIQLAKTLKPELAKKLIKSNTESASQAQKQQAATVKAMPTKKQIAFGAAGTAADIATAGTIKLATTGVKTAKIAKASSLLAKTKKAKAGELGADITSNVASAGFNAAAGGGDREEIMKNAAIGAVFPVALSEGAHLAVKAGGKSVVNATGKVKAPLGKDKATNSLITQAKTAALMDNANKTAGVGKVATGLDDSAQRALDDTMSKVKAPKSVTDAANAEAKAATDLQATTAKNTEATAKIDQKIELIEAKKADGKFTNVDKVKVEQLKAEKQAFTPAANTVDDVASEPVAKSIDTAAPATPEVKSVNGAVKESLLNDTAKADVPVANKTEAKAPTTLKPTQTAHMESVGGYTHTEHMTDDYANMLREMDKTAQGGNKYQATESGRTLMGGKSRFYSDHLRETGKPPTKADYIEEAKRQLESGKAAYGASDDYKKLLEREAKPVPRLEVEKTVTPAEQGTSKVAQRIAADIKLKYGDGELAGFDKITLEDQANKALKLLDGEREALNKVISGTTPLPDGLRATSIITAIRHHPTLSKDSELMRKLAKSPLASESSFSAQELRLARENAKDDPIMAIKQLGDTRVAAFEKRSGKTVNKAVGSEVKQIRAATPKVTKETWDSFVESIKC